ncbi:MAG: VOC family protein, partial [Chloroflexia bacterium]
MAKLDMVGLTVNNMAESLAFYKLLGLEVPKVPEGEDYAEVITPEGYRVSWNTVEMIKGIDPDWKEPVGQRIGLAFKCSSPAEVDELYNKATAAGYHGHKEPWDAFWGQRYAVLLDPDGSTVDIFA